MNFRQFTKISPLVSLAALGMLLVAGPLQAAGTATVEGKGDRGTARMEIVWAGENMRMDFPAEPGTYIIVRDGKSFSITNQEGRTMVMDMASMGRMVEVASAQAGLPLGPDTAGSLKSIEATGKSETVAGIQGEVHQITWTDADGNARSDTAVLTDEPLVQELTAAMTRHVEALDIEATNSVSQAIKERNQGVLRFGEHFRVLSISDAAPQASSFELPAEPMTLQDMMKGMREALGR